MLFIIIAGLSIAAGLIWGWFDTFNTDAGGSLINKTAKRSFYYRIRRG